MNVLSTLIDLKRPELSRLAVRPLAPAPATARRSLARAASTGGVIAELKRRSPSRGELVRGDELYPDEIARSYARGGAVALSVLTDQASFGGSFEDLARVARATDLPLLCKDFIVTEAQIDHAAAAGASAVLLIVAALDPRRLLALRAHARDAGLEVLVEAHDEAEIAIAEAVDPELVGVNNRDLRTLESDLGACERLLPRISRARVRVAESGVGSAADARRMFAAGADSLLVGEALLRAPDRAALVAALAGGRT